MGLFIDPAIDERLHEEIDNGGRYDLDPFARQPMQNVFMAERIEFQVNFSDDPDPLARHGIPDDSLVERGGRFAQQTEQGIRIPSRDMGQGFGDKCRRSRSASPFIRSRTTAAK